MTSPNQDKLLVDRVAALGVVAYSGMWGYRLGPEGGPMWDLSKHVVRDWRVAGALMGKVYFFSSGEFMVLCNQIKHIEVRDGKALIRAIIEAAVEWLERV